MKKALLAGVILVFVGLGCATKMMQPSAVTPGMAKKKIIKGQTTQAEVVQIFGAPNLVTKMQNGGELWVYSNCASVRKAIGLGLGAGILGGGGSIGGGAGIGGSFGSSVEQSRNINFMVKFDKNEVVIDYYFSQLQY